MHSNLHQRTYVHTYIHMYVHVHKKVHTKSTQDADHNSLEYSQKYRHTAHEDHISSLYTHTYVQSASQAHYSLHAVRCVWGYVRTYVRSDVRKKVAHTGLRSLGPPLGGVHGEVEVKAIINYVHTYIDQKPLSFICCLAGIVFSNSCF